MSQRETIYIRKAMIMTFALVTALSLSCAGCASNGSTSTSSTSATTADAVENTSSSGVVMSKHASYNVACADCHGDGDQSTYTAPSSSTCLSCHEGSYDALAELTSNANGGSTYLTNPHASHIGDADCTLCHRNHSESTLYCNQCHTPEFDLVTP